MIRSSTGEASSRGPFAWRPTRRPVGCPCSQARGHNFLHYQKRDFLDRRFNIWLGAYLGEVMVRHLGGEWVPRKDLLESQVRVGDRAWLPFLRVRNSLQTRQSLVDHSLAQFYRAAERHLRGASSTAG